ncbi:fumarylacetoacetase [Streptosporangium becharense]|uniref:fumarylacetoacetase n=1 Tax=Streptosporangium becharense TaxID=1816182 RepID=A0A7W9IGL4_9ACTN|nr:fumarylacetoacetate hydrolase family protein [Streptosporangium becharense]MBB2909282.1 fumarylacetoacetase [Streptosporangium becharense]MBB5819699.1 fumarylacetoacetase [Streptosporangium becharense]
MTTCWVKASDDSGFPVSNLPYGVFSRRGEFPRVGVAVGGQVLDLSLLAANGVLKDSHWFASGTLNAFLSAGPRVWQSVREQLISLLTEPARRPAVLPALVPVVEVRMHLPFHVGDLIRFQTSIEHETNLGRMFRPPADPLPRNWPRMPIGQYGRASSVVVSGTPVVRPYGQLRGPGESDPVFGPSTRLDLSAEIGYVVGGPTPSPHGPGTWSFEDHVFGVVLVNGWRAWDIIAWESAPLGPFLGQFATSVSPWVVPLAALEHARVAPPVQDPPPPPYLAVRRPWGLDLTLRVELNGRLLSEPPFAVQYWTGPQLFAHMSVGGAPLRAGDLITSGPVSGSARSQFGTLLELAWNGRDPLGMPDGTERVFLEDGDTVRITAAASGPEGIPLSLGEVTGTVRPAA